MNQKRNEEHEAYMKGREEYMAQEEPKALELAEELITTAVRKNATIDDFRKACDYVLAWNNEAIEELPMPMSFMRNLRSRFLADSETGRCADVKG